MRFEELNPAAFGHFTDYPVTFQKDRSFHVLFGNNEAGKSTMLRSITQLLYGIPHNSKDSFIHANSNLRIKGRISNSSGDQLTFVRRKGKTKTILNESGEALPDHVLFPYINALSEETFRSMFALNHETLREGGEALLESNGNVGESLFAAASGINAVKKVMQEFDAESRELYKSGGSKPKINELLKKEKELTRSMLDSQMLARQWKQLEEDYLNGKTQLEELKRQYLHVDAALKKLSKLKQAAPKLMERKSLMEQLIEHQDTPDLPGDLNIQREQAVNALSHADENAKFADTEIRALKEKLSALKVDERILSCESLIQSLFSHIGAYEKESKDMRINETNAEQASNRIHSILLMLGYNGLNSVNMEKFRIPSTRKEKIRYLYKQYGILQEAIKEIKKRLQNLEQIADEKHAEWNSIGELKDLSALKMTLSLAQDGNIENTIAVLNQEMNELKNKTVEELKHLPLWNGSLEDFTAFSVSILEETIQGCMNQLNQLNEDKANLERAMNVEKTIIQEAEKSIAELEVNSKIPTEEVLVHKREIRNIGWSIIKKKLKGETIDKEAIDEYRNQQNLEEKFEADLRKTDELSDIMWRESAKVGRKDKSLQDIARSEAKIAEIEHQLECLETEIRQFYQKWDELWEPFTIKPLNPVEMKEWLTKYKALKQNQSEYKKKQLMWAELTEKRLAIKKRLFDALSSVCRLDKSSVTDWSLPELIRESESIIQLETERINEKKSLEREWLSKVADLKQCKNDLESKQQELIEWKEKWEEAIVTLDVDGGISIDATLEILEKYDELISTFDEWCHINSKVHASKVFINEYMDRIGSVIDTVEQAQPSNIQSFVYDLYKLLQEQKKCQQNLCEWQEQLEKRKNEYTLAVEKKKMAENRLNEVLEATGAKTIEEMILIEEKYNQKQKLIREINHLEKVLLEIGNGLSIEEMKEELAKLDLDFIDSEIAELKAELADLEEKRAEQNQLFGVCKKEYDEKIKGHSYAAVQAAEERESVLAELAELADQFIQKKLAAFVLQKGIEHFRSANQNPILTRASHLFSRLTLGSFEGLTVDYNDKDEEVLYGLRNSEKIGIDAMSDGTKDQLYLSLRVASIERYCEENEPIPFIVDDILVHFDNERSKMTLSILKELATKTQIIFFTHHYHLIHLLEDTLDDEDYQLINIHKEATVS